MADRDLFLLRFEVCDGPVWEVRQNGLIELDFTLAGSDTDQCGHDALGDRGHVVWTSAIVRVMKIGI